MRLSPFEQGLGDDWPAGAPLYGRVATWGQHPGCAFEVFPARPGEEITNAHRIPRQEDEYDPESIGFDITKPDSDLDHIRMINTYDRPTLQWFTREQFEDRFRYNPLDPPRPQGVHPEEWTQQAKERAQNNSNSSLTLTRDRVTLLKRIGNLWNGETVCGKHLLADQCPSITDFTADLDEDELRRLYYNTELGRETLLAFGDADWFEQATGFLKPTTVFRKQVWYDLSYKTRWLFNNLDELPTLRGDPNEGLVHRLTVGLVCLRNALRDRRYGAYSDWRSYTIDAIGKDEHGQMCAYEILTEHNNWKLYRNTYRKMRALNQNGITPIAVFDGRSTAYTVFNHWHREGLAELPNGPFNSDFNVEDGQEQIETAYEDPGYDWAVADWTTTWKLKENLLGQDGPELTKSKIASLTW